VGVVDSGQREGGGGRQNEVWKWCGQSHLQFKTWVCGYLISFQLQARPVLWIRRVGGWPPSIARHSLLEHSTTALPRHSNGALEL
jgi:hypothetical protein